jgi:hypothetical protein
MDHGNQTERRLCFYRTKFDTRREVEIVDRETYLFSGIWFFRTVPIAPTNNIPSISKLRPTHFLDTAIATALLLSFCLSEEICRVEKETDTNKEEKSRGRRRRRRTGERVRGRSPTKRSLYRARKTTQK